MYEYNVYWPLLKDCEELGCRDGDLPAHGVTANAYVQS